MHLIRLDRHCRKFWGQAAIAIVGYGSSAGWNFCPKTGAESAIIDGATNLKQQIGAASRPARLLGFTHSAVHQEIARPFGERGSNARAPREPGI
jgi:hypothetical protein